ncbi:MAG: 4-hydroxy-tetrahydrodipicolinate reductase [Gammaproteobacteria bacterium]|nr:4-hydroxy-tetrahydrodipicolinate reductase [Gammaproteobacteria bacterium]
MIRIGVTGANGRMGQAVIAALKDLDESHGLRLAGAHLRSDGAPAVADDVTVSRDLPTMLAGVDVVIDFTLPSLTSELAAGCRDAGVALVCGTTGLGEAQMAALRELSKTQPVFYARNMSVGVNLLLDLVARASKALGVDYDAEIVEAHHRHKQDAPSGTALAIGEAVASARGQVLKEVIDHGREGRTGEREPGRIGMHALRAGEIVGEHDLRLVGGGEELRLGHSAFSRRAFADGALRAAAWVSGQSPGFYGYPDMLGNAD